MMSGDHACEGNSSRRGRSSSSSTSTSRHHHAYSSRRGSRLLMLIVALLIFLQVATMLWTLNSRNDASLSNCDEMTTHQQRQQQHDGSSSSSSSSTSSALLRTSFRTMSNSNEEEGPACALVMEKFHQINEAYRQGEPNATTTSFPVINYALYPGQGFGRLIDHAIFHGLMALALDRPVALYLADRDPYYTWRSYIATGTYDWEMRGPLLEYPDEIQRAIGVLPSEKSSEWTIQAAQNFHHRYHLDYDANQTNKNATTTTIRTVAAAAAADVHTPPPPRLHLLHRPARWPEKSIAKLFWNRIQPWHAAINTANSSSLTTTTTTTTTIVDNNHHHHESSSFFVSPDAAILSPNWGSVWFPSLSMPGVIQGCPLDRLKGHMQNAMFAPTPRTLHLHQQRLVKVLPGAAALRSENKDALYPYYSYDNNYYYGSIHIRTYMLKMGNRGEIKMQKLYATLVSCLQHVSEQLLRLDEPKNITAWWILSDNVDLAMALSSNVTDFRLYNAYGADHGHGDFVLNNKHSATPQVARGVYGQRGMAPSVLDWTVLHQSQVALVTEGTSFGGTGARGNGKFKRNVPRQTCSYFEVYF